MNKRVLTRRGVPVVALGLAAALTFAGGSTFAQNAGTGEKSPFTLPSAITTSGPTSESNGAEFQSLIQSNGISWVFGGPTIESTKTHGTLESAPINIQSLVSAAATSENNTVGGERIPVTIGSVIEGYSSSNQVTNAVTAFQTDSSLEQVGLGAVGVAVGNNPSPESSNEGAEQVGLGATGVIVGRGPSSESSGSTLEQVGLGAVGVAVGSGPSVEAAGSGVEQVGQGAVDAGLSGGPNAESGEIPLPEQLSPFGLSSSSIEG